MAGQAGGCEALKFTTATLEGADLQPERVGLAEAANARRRARKDQVSGLERHKLKGWSNSMRRARRGVTRQKLGTQAAKRRKTKDKRPEKEEIRRE